LSTSKYWAFKANDDFRGAKHISFFDHTHGSALNIQVSDWHSLALKHTHSNTHTLKHTHSNTHTQTHTLKHTHTQTHAVKHTLPFSLKRGWENNIDQNCIAFHTIREQIKIRFNLKPIFCFKFTFNKHLDMHFQNKSWKGHPSLDLSQNENLCWLALPQTFGWIYVFDPYANKSAILRFQRRSTWVTNLRFLKGCSCFNGLVWQLFHRYFPTEIVS